jgi:hypothetical protein
MKDEDRIFWLIIIVIVAVFFCGFFAGKCYGTDPNVTIADINDYWTPQTLDPNLFDPNKWVLPLTIHEREPDFDFVCNYWLYPVWQTADKVKRSSPDPNVPSESFVKLYGMPTTARVNFRHYAIMAKRFREKKK